MTGARRVFIVGGEFGGAHAAHALRRAPQTDDHAAAGPPPHDHPDPSPQCAADVLPRP
ncbi:MAG: hypothetical protein ACREQX_08535 [Candidatus Binataceae bacterium]